MSEVVAARRRAALSSKLTGTEISVRYSTAFAEAFKNASAIMVGWRPLLSILSAAPSMLPASTTTEVVPSPASTSCAAERSTSYAKYVRSSTPDEIKMHSSKTDHFCSRMKSLNAPQNGGSIVGDDNFPLGGLDLEGKCVENVRDTQGD